MSTFNVLEASIRFGVKRFVNVSSETVPGFFFPERPFLPDYAPDNVGGRDFNLIFKQFYGDKIELRPVDRTDASGISSAKAQEKLGWKPRRSWRDYLDSNGRAKSKKH